MEEYAYTGKAMGTDYAISIVCESREHAEQLSVNAIRTIEEYEQRFSRFLAASELSRLNAEKKMIVSEEFMNVTKKARALFILTKGMFNPLVQIERKGYNKDFSTIDEATFQEPTDTYNIDFESVHLHTESNEIELHQGQKLDFGGFLKGYLAERICKKIMKDSSSVTGAIVNIGGDIHTQGVDASGTLFSFDIFNPVTKEEIPITLHNESLATSGTYKRTWQKSATPIHHILDASGLRNPSSDIVSASVICADGGKAEAYAKVFLNLGEQAEETLPNEGITFLIISKDGTVTKNI